MLIFAKMFGQAVLFAKEIMEFYLYNSLLDEGPIVHPMSSAVRTMIVNLRQVGFL